LVIVDFLDHVHEAPGADRGDLRNRTARGKRGEWTQYEPAQPALNV
jgi:hypothetical protein